MTVAQAPLGVLHYVDQTIYKAQKALIAAKFNGIAVTQKKFDPKDAEKPSFIEMNPMCKVPFLQTNTGCISSSNAVARYIARCRADTGLYGYCFDDESQIDTWMEFCTFELEVPLNLWLYSVIGVIAPPPAEKMEESKKDVKQALQLLEESLKESPFLTGDSLSLADVVIVCALKDAFMRIFDPAFRKPYPKVCAWFERCCSMPQFKDVFGNVALCKEAEKPKTANNTPTAQKEPKKETKKAEPKKEAAPKASPQHPHLKRK
jgi:elongation factor 1-gamma